MARTLRMPSEADLPPGAVRRFAAEVFDLYREARRPTLRQVSEAIRRNENLAGTASPETIRRMLLGLTVPTHWPAVEAVLVVLCDLAEVNPDAEVWNNDSDTTRRRSLESVWHRALDHPDELDEPVVSATSAADPATWEPADRAAWEALANAEKEEGRSKSAEDEAPF